MPDAGHLRDDGAAVEVLWHEGGHKARPGKLSATAEFRATSGRVTQGKARGG